MLGEFTAVGILGSFYFTSDGGEQFNQINRITNAIIRKSPGPIPSTHLRGNPLHQGWLGPTLHQ